MKAMFKVGDTVLVTKVGWDDPIEGEVTNITAIGKETTYTVKHTHGVVYARNEELCSDPTQSGESTPVDGVGDNPF